LAGVSVWLIVALLMALPVIRSAWAVRRMKREATKMPQALEQRVQHWAKRLNIRQPVTLMASDGITVPVTTGVIRPIILLPASSVRTLDESTLDHTLIHELAHIKRKDHWVKSIQVIVCALVWFHPALWWINRKLNLEREIACDEAVLIHANTKPNRYTQSLILWAEGALNHRVYRVTVPFIVRSQLEKRVTTMMKSKKKLTLNLSKTRLLLLAGVVGIVITALAPLFPAIGVADVESNLYWVRDGVLERADLDGSNIEIIPSNLTDLPDQNLFFRLPPIIDPATQSVYWIDEIEAEEHRKNANQILRAPFFAQEPEVLERGTRMSNLNLDPNTGKMYWVENSIEVLANWPNGPSNPDIHRELLTVVLQSDSNGTNVRIVSQFLTRLPDDFSFDVNVTPVLKFDGLSNKLYYVNEATDGVYIIDLDGSEPEFVPWPKDPVADFDLNPISALNIKIVQEERLRMYWKDQRGRILRMNLDGGDVDYQQVLYNMEEGLVGRLVRKLMDFDFVGRHIYWISQPSGQVHPVLRKAQLDEPGFAFRNGLKAPIIFDFADKQALPPSIQTAERYGVFKVIVDEQSRKLYWVLVGGTEGSISVFAIQQSDLDGNNIKTLVDGLEGRLSVFALQ
jgi:hypothetical protein